ncbi:hypothetical protein B0H19DRAFT_1275227 [Mycena capillaripes]|nr:hypothetical protein B0H19DRAFT_1275227 [Mycena capillaripes]
MQPDSLRDGVNLQLRIIKPKVGLTAAHELADLKAAAELVLEDTSTSFTSSTSSTTPLKQESEWPQGDWLQAGTSMGTLPTQQAAGLQWMYNNFQVHDFAQTFPGDSLTLTVTEFEQGRQPDTTRNGTNCEHLPKNGLVGILRRPTADCNLAVAPRFVGIPISISEHS